MKRVVVTVSIERDCLLICLDVTGRFVVSKTCSYSQECRAPFGLTGIGPTKKYLQKRRIKKKKKKKKEKKKEKEEERKQK